MENLVMNVGELAKVLGINPQTVLKHRADVRVCLRLVSLPEPFVARPKLLWWRADIEAWAESKRTFKSTQVIPPAAAIVDAPLLPQKRKVGRPTNVEKSVAKKELELHRDRHVGKTT